MRENTINMATHEPWRNSLLIFLVVLTIICGLGSVWSANGGDHYRKSGVLNISVCLITSFFRRFLRRANEDFQWNINGFVGTSRTIEEVKFDTVPSEQTSGRNSTLPQLPRITVGVSYICTASAKNTQCVQISSSATGLFKEEFLKQNPSLMKGLESLDAVLEKHPPRALLVLLLVSSGVSFLLVCFITFLTLTNLPSIEGSLQRTIGLILAISLTGLLSCALTLAAVLLAARIAAQAASSSTLFYAQNDGIASRCFVVFIFNICVLALTLITALSLLK